MNEENKVGDTKAKEAGGGRKARRIFSPEKKSQIFLDAQRTDKPVAEVLRREGLYSTDLARIQQEIKQEALEAEVADVLVREYDEREGEGLPDWYRNGYRRGGMKTAEGEVEYAVP